MQNVEERFVKKRKKRKATSRFHLLFTKGIDDHSRPTIKFAMQSKEKLHDVDLDIVMWFSDTCVPTNDYNSPYIQHTEHEITGFRYGYKTPNYNALRVNLLSRR